MVRLLVAEAPNVELLVLDKLTYAGNRASLPAVSEGYQFVQSDICDRPRLTEIFKEFRPDAVMHLAAESHVDRSLDAPTEFIDTNIVGTFNLLEVTREYLQNAPAATRQNFRFHHVSTDEVFGDLEHADDFFHETTPYQPSSPYSASKAASDHLVRAWQRSYDIPVLLTNCSNNYGPYQFPEKLIPHMILNAVAGKPLPIYGNGQQIRDWLYVEDHARALWLTMTDGQIGETYLIGGHNEQANLDVVHLICEILAEQLSEQSVADFTSLIEFVTDRPGHDRRYAIDASKIERELGWRPVESFASGLEKTVRWYLQNNGWWQAILDGSYRLGRIGTGK